MRQIVPQTNLSLVPADATKRDDTVEGAVALVIPCYRVTRQILAVLRSIPSDIDQIYAVDDACPDGSGDLIERHCRDPRVQVLRHPVNQGVGGAMVTGIRQAIADGAQVIVKMDGDGQMDPQMLPVLIDVVRSGAADYAKGNRFFDPEDVAAMPWVRLLGNAALSFFAKLSTGYWQSFDPTNGYFAIHAEIARRIPWDKVARRYFFETDILFRLSTIRARVMDVPMPAIYGDETSGLNSARMIGPFLLGHLRNFGKRLVYNYFLRDFSFASAQLLIGTALLLFGVVFGLTHWLGSATFASAGTVMLAGLSVMLGVQLLLAFLAYDIQSTPNAALHPLLSARAKRLRRHASAKAS